MPRSYGTIGRRAATNALTHAATRMIYSGSRYAYNKGKKKYKSYYAPKRRKYYIPRGIFAKTFRQSFRYHMTTTLDPGSTASIAYLAASANSLYDPGVTTDTRKVHGFDELVGVFYNHYTVTNCKMKVTFLSTSSSQTLGSAIVGIMPMAGATVVSSGAADVLENRSSRHKILTCSTAGQKVSMTANMNLGRYLSHPNILDEDDNAGTVSSSPDRDWETC